MQMAKNENPIVNVSQKRRIFLDLNVKVADMAKEKAAQMRVATKRYIEALIERDCSKKSK